MKDWKMRKLREKMIKAAKTARSAKVQLSPRKEPSLEEKVARNFELIKKDMIQFFKTCELENGTQVTVKDNKTGEKEYKVIREIMDNGDIVMTDGMIIKYGSLFVEFDVAKKRT